MCQSRVRVAACWVSLSLGLFLVAQPLLGATPRGQGNFRKYTSQKTWNVSSRIGFHKLTTVGTLMSAFLSAKSRAAQYGQTVVEPKSVTIDSNWISGDREYLRATAIVHTFPAQIQQQVGRKNTFTQTSRWTFGRYPDQLTILGVQWNALQTALNRCYQEYAHCALLSIDMETVTESEAVAKASVFGFSFDDCVALISK